MTEKIQDTYMWNIIACNMGWRWHTEGADNLDGMGFALRRHKIDMQDVAVIFYSKLARYGQDSLMEKINKAFKEWVEENHNEAQEIYNIQLSPEGKKQVDEIVAQLKSL